MGTGFHKPGVSGSSPDAATVRFDEPIEDYHSSDGWSSTQLADFLKSPQLFYRRHIAKIEPGFSSSALARGSLAHTCLEIGPDETERRLLVVPGEHLTSTGISSKKATVEWLDSLEKYTIPVSPQDYDFIFRMWQQCRENTAVWDILQRIKHQEVSIRFEHKDFLLRVRPDAILECGQVIDFKTSRHGNPVTEFYRSVEDYRYDLSNALYSKGGGLAGFSSNPLIYIVISTTSGEVHALTLPKRIVERGKRELDRVLADLEMRLDLDDWLPRSYGEVTEMHYPTYLMKGSK
jgi:hypothetical protein